jgi:hypothetical protein
MMVKDIWCRRKFSCFALADDGRSHPVQAVTLDAAGPDGNSAEAALWSGACILACLGI